jgi:hypothetical protein
MIHFGNAILGLKCGKSDDEFGEHVCFIVYVLFSKVMLIIDNTFTDFRIELLDRIKFSISLQFCEIGKGR